MTVATVVLVPDPAAAFEPIDGDVPLRRILRAAWAGGSIPAVLVSSDPEGRLREAARAGELGEEGAPSVLVPGPDVPHGVGWFAAGLSEAAVRVTDTRAALLWPFRYPWVDPETITSLIEAHGARPDAIIRPTFGGEPGFPALIPAAYHDELAAMPGRHGPDALAALAGAGVPAVTVEVGDPGVVFDLTTPPNRLPAYHGPSEPAGGAPPEWNEALGVRAGDPANTGNTGAGTRDAIARRDAARALEGGAAPFDQVEREQ